MVSRRPFEVVAYALVATLVACAAAAPSGPVDASGAAAITVPPAPAPKPARGASRGALDSAPADILSTAPEGASAYRPKPGWAFTRFAVAAANPLAAQAGASIIEAGGSAVDAAVAVQLVLGLVEPQSSGIGGGAFLLHHDGKKVEAYDGRETAPLSADERLFLLADGKPMPFAAAVTGGRAVGVPGVLRMLELAHREHGRLPWAALFEPAIRLAETGFDVSERLHAIISQVGPVGQDPAAAAYFLDARGAARAVGDRLRNPEYAALLRRVAREGTDAFYRGEVAQAIVDKVRAHPTNAGRLALADLAGYQPKKREPLCHDHMAGGREYRICGFPPPGSGAIAIAQILEMLRTAGANRYGLANGLPSADWLHLYTEAARLAFADRGQYIGDPDFVAPPAGSWSSLLAPAYLAQRARLIGERSMKVASPGDPTGAQRAFAAPAQQPEYGTSHIAIVDARGNAVAMTTTIEQAFGSRQMVKGFLLNNELTDFDFVPTDALGRPAANRVQPGKRPRSSMSPTFVFDKSTGRLVLTVGSAGGAAIIHHTAKVLHAVLEWGLDAQQAVDLPNFGSFNGPTWVERQRFPRSTLEALRSRGHDLREQDATSGLVAIQKTQGGYFGAADPRREGAAAGR